MNVGDADGKILVEDIVKLGTVSEAVDGDLDIDLVKPKKKQEAA